MVSLQAHLRELNLGLDDPAKVRLLPDDRDNDCVLRFIEHLRELRHDSNEFGNLLATLCIPQNRDTIRQGRKQDIDDLFDIIDGFASRHSQRNL